MILPKFRAWLKSVGEMVEVLEIDFYNKEVAYIWTEQVSHYELEQTREVDKIDDLILMQSIGLRDKNGLEIFEGDYLSLIIFEANKEHKGEVVFSKGSFCLTVQIKGHEYTVPFHEMSEVDILLEVLGNIWENPELMEVE